MKTIAALMLAGAFLMSQPAFAAVVVGSDGKAEEKAPKAKKDKADKADKADKQDKKEEKKEEKKAEKGGW